MQYQPIYRQGFDDSVIDDGDIDYKIVTKRLLLSTDRITATKRCLADVSLTNKHNGGWCFYYSHGNEESCYRERCKRYVQCGVEITQLRHLATLTLTTGSQIEPISGAYHFHPNGGYLNRVYGEAVIQMWKGAHSGI
jgi:hypothetical protein